MIDRSHACLICPFTCKGASECKPRLLVSELRNYLPSPRITFKADIGGREYRF